MENIEKQFSEDIKHIDCDLAYWGDVIYEALSKALRSQQEKLKTKVLKEVGAHTSPHTDNNCTYCRIDKKI